MLTEFLLMFSLEQRLAIAVGAAACVWIIWQSFKSTDDPDHSGIGPTDMPHEPGSALRTSTENGLLLGVATFSTHYGSPGAAGSDGGGDGGGDVGGGGA